MGSSWEEFLERLARARSPNAHVWVCADQQLWEGCNSFYYLKIYLFKRQASIHLPVNSPKGHKGYSWAGGSRKLLLGLPLGWVQGANELHHPRLLSQARYQGAGPE